MKDMAQDPMQLPPDLPEPENDGAAEHLAAMKMPALELPATDGRTVSLDQPGAQGRTVLYAYPRTGRLGEAPLTDDWDLIPGARGCTPQACAFRDHYSELQAAGADVFGISTQSTEYQREAAERLHLPFALLSDAQLRLTNALGLPTFSAAGQTLLKRLTIIIRNGHIEHAMYPVLQPERHAEHVLAWLNARG